MPKPQKQAPFVSSSKRSEQIGAGMLIAVLGMIWLAAELGAIKTSVPIGPLSLIIAGLALAAPHLRKE